MRRTLPATLILLPALATAASADLDPSFGLLGVKSSDYAAPTGRRIALRAMGAVGAGYGAIVERDVPGGGTRLELLRMDARGLVSSASAIDFPVQLVVDAHVGADGSAWLAAIAPTAPDTVAAAVAKIRPDGTPDLAFGNGVSPGLAFIEEPGQALVSSALAVTPEGQVAIAGYRRMLSAPNASAGTFVARLDAGGMPVASFSGDGLAHVDVVPLRADFPRAVVLEASGKVLVCDTADYVGQDDAVLTRLDADGEVADFGTDGTLIYDTTPPGQPDFFDACEDVDVQPGTGAIVMTVRRSNGSVRGVRRVPVDEDGNAGLAFDNVATPPQSSARLQFDALGRSILAVTSVRPTGIDVDLVRFAPNGAGDATFGIGGVVRHDVPRPVGATLSELSFENTRLLIDARGRILAGGTLVEQQDDGAGWAMLRMQGDVAFVNGFE